MAPRLKVLPAALAAVAVALLIAAIAVKSLIASWIALPAGDALERLRAGQPVTIQEARIAATASYRAGRVFEPGRYNSDAALAAGRLPEAERRTALNGVALPQLVDQALIAAPASPHNWARRASLQLARRDYAGARRSLETSLALGRFVPGLTVPRLGILFALMRRAPDPQLDVYFDEQIRIAAASEPAALAGFVVQHAGAEGRAQRLLSTDYMLYKPYLDNLIEVRRNQPQQGVGK